MPLSRLRPALALLALIALLALAACTPITRSLRPSPAASDPSASSPPLASSIPTTSTAAPGDLAPVSINWHACTPGAFQCSSIAVPLDWSQPHGPTTVRLSLIRLPASGPASQRIGSLFVNPGGPGASAQDLVRSSQGIFSSEILRRFDIVGFDPRGVGGSQPLICENGQQMDAFLAANPVPHTPAEVQAVIDADKQFADGCVKAAGSAFLAHMDTQSAARDMDYIRASVGDAKLSYVGYSYGTFLGAQYAGLFPSHVRALVLDGAIDPNLSPLEFDQQQGVGFDTELNHFFDNCTKACPFYNGGNPRAAFAALEAKVAAQPIPVGPRQLTQALFLNGVAGGMYAPSQWNALDSALAQAQNGNGTALLAMSDEQTGRKPDGTYDPLTSVNVAVNCVDASYPKDLAAYQAAADQSTKTAPIIGPADVWSALACANWPVPPAVRRGVIKATGAPPILVVGTTGDPATPYSQAVSLAGQLSSGVLLTHVGEGHTSLGEGSGCVDNAVSTYLINLSPPPDKSICGKSGAPTPSPGAAPVALRP